MAPMETQVREHQLQLRRRLESIKRIHKATDTLEDRISELEQMEHNILDQLDELNDMHNTLVEALAVDANAETQAWA
jgi:prefoldin subunit 5